MKLKLADTLEETLRGGYHGLYGEVVTNDIYRLRSIQFNPDVILDIGANVGIFSRFARSLFPDAQIVAVEPDPENAAHFRKFTDDSNTILYEMALGQGPIYHGLTAANGAMEVYLSSGLGYPKKDMESAARKKKTMEKSVVPTVTLAQIAQKYLAPGKKGILKVDCEGAENTIWLHAESMEALRMMEYITMELHWYALHGGLLDTVRSVTQAALASLERTHDCHLEGCYFWATKRQI